MVSSIPKGGDKKIAINFRVSLGYRSELGANLRYITKPCLKKEKKSDK